MERDSLNPVAVGPPHQCQRLSRCQWCRGRAELCTLLEKSPWGQAHYTKPLQQTHHFRQSDFKGIIKAWRNIYIEQHKLVLSPGASECEMKKKEKGGGEKMDSVIIAFESVQISHTQPFPNLLRFKSFPR